LREPMNEDIELLRTADIGSLGCGVQVGKLFPPVSRSAEHSGQGQSERR
jgi:hypothetical protein